MYMISYQLSTILLCHTLYLRMKPPVAKVYTTTHVFYEVKDMFVIS